MASTARLEQITLGEFICSKIKDIYFNEEPWSPILSDKVANKFTQLKCITRNLYKDKSEIDLLKHLCKFDRQSFVDCFEFYNGKEMIINEVSMGKNRLSIMDNES